MKLDRYTSVSCGVEKREQGRLLQVSQVASALDWIADNDDPKEMLSKIEQLKEQLT